MRFTSVELGELESKIAGASDRVLALEAQVFDGLSQRVMAQADTIADIADALSALDVAASHAELAVELDWTRPRLDDSLAFAIEGGRHPVVEAALRKAGEAFIANACDLSGVEAGRIRLVTGPNMGGKSTFLRQNALVIVLAQMGAFVPARCAISAWSIGCSPASGGGRPRAGALDLHGRNGRDRRDPEPGDAPLPRRPRRDRRSAPRPSTGSPSPGPAWSTCTRRTAAGRCSPRISTS